MMIIEKYTKDKIILATGMVILAITIFFIGVLHGSSIKALDMVEIYDAGKKDALKITPRPSLELEMTCANIWAGKAALPEVLK
jgi:hypothetical protein